MGDFEKVADTGKKRPFLTVKEALVAAFIIFFTGIAFERIELTPQAPLRSVLNAEVEAYKREITTLPISEVVKKLENNGGKPTLMVLYASWCGSCKLLMPNIAALKQEGKLDNANLLFISLDKDITRLSTYLLQRDYNRIFSGYILERPGMEGITNMMIAKGSSYSGAIPFTAIFDKNGKVVFTLTGATNKPYFEDIINKYVANSL